jgi:hypothetical protein
MTLSHQSRKRTATSPECRHCKPGQDQLSASTSSSSCTLPTLPRGRVSLVRFHAYIQQNRWALGRCSVSSHELCCMIRNRAYLRKVCLEYDLYALRCTLSCFHTAIEGLIRVLQFCHTRTSSILTVMAFLSPTGVLRRGCRIVRIERHCCARDRWVCLAVRTHHTRRSSG